MIAILTTCNTIWLLFLTIYVWKSQKSQKEYRSVRDIILEHERY